MKTYLYAGLAIFVIFSHGYAYFKGKSAGKSEIIAQNGDLVAKQQKAIQDANKKILDFQRIIVYNNDECFNRVWDESIINATNPQLR